MLKRTRLIGVSVAALVLVSTRGEPTVAPPLIVAAPNLTDLRGVDELKGLFNSDTGKVRLVLLISPT